MAGWAAIVVQVALGGGAAAARVDTPYVATAGPPLAAAETPVSAVRAAPGPLWPPTHAAWLHA